MALSSIRCDVAPPFTMDEAGKLVTAAPTRCCRPLNPDHMSGESLFVVTVIKVGDLGLLTDSDGSLFVVNAAEVLSYSKPTPR